MQRADSALSLIDAARREGRAALDEPGAKRILSLYGLRSPRSLVLKGRTGADAALEEVGERAVLKLISPDVLHKSDFGGVALGLESGEQVRAAMADMTRRCTEHGARLDGFLLEEQVQGGHEIVIGGFQDPTFGPVIMLGLGGIFVEIIRDVSFRICPITPIDALEMLNELRGVALLRGARGGAAVPDAVITDALLAVGGEQGLLSELSPDVSELDINPVAVSAQGAVALDARIVLAAGAALATE